MGKTVVIGGGVVGLLSALELSRRGESVTVLERGEPGAACSKGNLGWIVPGLSDPLAAPGLIRTSIRWMLRGDSPLYIHPAALPRLAGWLWHFWRRCNSSDYEHGLSALASLNRTTIDHYEALSREGVAFEMHRSRLLMVSVNESAVDRAHEEFDELARVGYERPERLTAEEARALEPALSPAVSGGLLYAEERHVRPETLCAGVAAHLATRGVNIRSGGEVSSVERRRDRITAAVTNEGAIEADRFLIAAGAWSGVLARQCGFHLPVQAGKGYSITLEAPAVRVNRPIHFENPEAACTPYNGALRVGGTMEFSGINTRLDPRRVAAIRRAAERYLPGIFDSDAGEEWIGMRPVLPDGLPAIGLAPGFENVYVATGHQMLGITLAPATAHAIADLITEGRSATDLTPFDPGRF